ncbi:MAG TPA: hypothetical protein VNE82_07260 [Candidatus Binataceae bacterium]|nr:hypothetical protein [Candidatus Binataceae bacterium]
MLLSICSMGVWLLANDPDITAALRRIGLEPHTETKSPNVKAASAAEQSAAAPTDDMDTPKFKLDDIPGRTASYYVTQRAPERSLSFAPEKHVTSPEIPETLRISYLDSEPIIVRRYIINGRVGKLSCDSSTQEPPPPTGLTPEKKKEMEFLNMVSVLAGMSLPQLPVHMETGDTITIPVPAIAGCGETIVRMDLYTDRGDVTFGGK